MVTTRLAIERKLPLKANQLKPGTGRLSPLKFGIRNDPGEPRPEGEQKGKGKGKGKKNSKDA